MNEPLLTADQVAELLAVDASWVREQARRETIPHLRLGRYVRFRRASIEEWLAERECGRSMGVHKNGRAAR